MNFELLLLEISGRSRGIFLHFGFNILAKNTFEKDLKKILGLHLTLLFREHFLEGPIFYSYHMKIR